MPFDIEADGPYFSVLDFFARLGRLSRIINVGDLKMSSLTGGTNQTVGPHRSRGFGDGDIHDYDFLYESGRCFRGACCRARK